jgi:hypothetical protein
LKLKHDDLLSKLAFKIDLRRYPKAAAAVDAKNKSKKKK